MAKHILQKGDPVLEKVSHPVTVFDWKLHYLLDEMQETLRQSGGLGLAAPQVGILRRAVLVMNEAGEVWELINPRLLDSSGSQEGFEGCLSLKGLYGKVTRPMQATVEAQNRNGETITVQGEGLTARCLCHEIEHLDGKLFDRLADRLYTEEELDEMMEKEP